jgi:hypothetical protein
MDDIFMDVLLLGDDDGLEIAGGIKMKTEGPQRNILIIDIVHIIEEEKNEETLFLESIIFAGFFIHSTTLSLDGL